MKGYETKTNFTLGRTTTQKKLSKKCMHKNNVEEIPEKKHFKILDIIV
jgi:hypothetical protein